MNSFEQLRRAVNDSRELWRAGEHDKAFNLLDDVIKIAIKENNISSILTASHHAAVLANSVGDLSRVRRYFEQSLAYNPENPRALYGLAKVFLDQKEPEMAKNYAARCRAAARGSEDEIDRGLLELLNEQWPEL